MANMPHVVTSLGNVRAHTRRVAEEITQRFRPIYFVWGIGPSGQHAEGRALDFMNYEYGGGVNSPGPERRSFGQQIADYLWQHRARLGVWYIIYNRRIISMTRPGDGWIPYNGSDPHTNHVHVSFYNGVSYTPPTGGKDDDLPYRDWPQADKNALVRDVAHAVWTSSTGEFNDDQRERLKLSQKSYSMRAVMRGIFTTSRATHMFGDTDRTVDNPDGVPTTHRVMWRNTRRDVKHAREDSRKAHRKVDALQESIAGLYGKLDTLIRESRGEGRHKADD